jgi:hypothetical protein
MGMPIIAYSNVQGSGGSTGWVTSLGTDWGHNVDADPLFVNAGGGDLRLLPGSPAIDAGKDSAVSGVATDLAGNPRISGPHVDMGAYETRLLTVYLPLVVRE